MIYRAKLGLRGLGESFPAAAVRSALDAVRSVNGNVNAAYQRNFNWYRDSASTLTPAGKAQYAAALNKQAGLAQQINEITATAELRAGQIGLSGYERAATLGAFGVDDAILLALGAGLLFSLYLVWQQSQAQLESAKAMKVSAESSAEVVATLTSKYNAGLINHDQYVTAVAAARKQPEQPSDVAKWIPVVFVGGLGLTGLLIATR